MCESTTIELWLTFWGDSQKYQEKLCVSIQDFCSPNDRGSVYTSLHKLIELNRQFRVRHYRAETGMW